MRVVFVSQMIRYSSSVSSVSTSRFSLGRACMIAARRLGVGFSWQICSNSLFVNRVSGSSRSSFLSVPATAWTSAPAGTCCAPRRKEKKIAFTSSCLPLSRKMPWTQPSRLSAWMHACSPVSSTPGIGMGWVGCAATLLKHTSDLSQHCLSSAPAARRIIFFFEAWTWKSCTVAGSFASNASPTNVQVRRSRFSLEPRSVAVE